MFSKLLKKSYFINAVSKFKYSSVGYDKYNLLKSTIPTCTMIDQLATLDALRPYLKSLHMV